MEGPYANDNDEHLQSGNLNQEYDGNLDDSGAANNGSSLDSSAGKLFVGGIAWETSQESFSNYFSNYGEITDSVIMMDKITGRPRGFGFVTFANPTDADKVLDQDHIIDGRSVEVKRTVPREDTTQGSRGVSRTKKVFVGGIPLTLTEDDLREYFSKYGGIIEHQIMLDHVTGRSRGFGFVTFDSEEAVDKIFADGQLHELGGKQVEIKRAEPKRVGVDFSYDNRSRRGGASKSYGGGFGRDSGSGGYGGGYGGKADRGYNDYGGGYAGYDGYMGGYGGGSTGFYGGYGGYGYGFGFGFGGPMYGGAGYAGAGFSGYGGSAGYGGGRGYGSGSGSGSGSGGGGGVGGKGFDRGAGSAGGYGYGYDGSEGYDNDNGGSRGGRYHPYRK